MKATFVLTAISAAGLVSADLTRCGTSEPSAEQMAGMNAVAGNSTSRVAAAATINVDTYVHVVTTSSKAGNYPQSMIDEQISVMNDAYSPLGVSFNLVDTDYTENNRWAAASAESQTEYEMKSALKQGSYADLNLYFLSDLGDGLLGFCYFPESSPSSEDLVLDGCTHLAASLPGAEATNYNLGLTAVHETGHWFGLYHVFQGSSCSGSGDYVADTPIQRTATSGCPSSQDSCPNSSGVDSIHNYMDYSYDECLYEFSDGQISRATAIYSQYRAGQ